MAATSADGVPSICRVCHHTCSILVQTEAGRATAVTGDPSSEVYQGYSCVKGRAQPALLRHPQRLTTSLKRLPSGAFEPIDVEKAMDEIAERLTGIRDAHGPRAIASYWGTTAGLNVTTTPVLEAFMKGLGSRMSFTANTIDKPGKSIAKALHGGWMAPPQGFDRPGVVLLVGMNPLVTYQGVPFGNPGTRLKELREAGAKLVVIDPRRSDAARRADLHLQPRPGWDAHLLAAMVRVIIDEGWHDAEFVRAHTEGLDALRRQVEPYDPETVSGKAGVSAADLRLAAQLFAEAERGYAVAGTGPAMSGPGVLVEYLVLNLMSLCGRWLRAGERVRNVPVILAASKPKAQAVAPRPAYGFGEHLRVRGLTDTAAGLPTAAAADEILLDGEGQVRALLSCGGNPVSAWPDTRKTVAALNKLDLLVHIDPWMSATAELADYVIAPAMPLERADMPVIADFQLAPHVGTVDSWAQYTPAIVERPPGSDLIEEWEFYFGLARRMGIDLMIDNVLFWPIPPFRLETESKPSTDELLHRFASGSRVGLDHVKEFRHGGSFIDPDCYVVEADADCTARLQLADRDMMRDLGELVAKRSDTTDGADGTFRLVCRRTPKALNSSCIDESTHRGRMYNPAFMHPADLHQLGVEPGGLVEISTASASIRAVADTDPNLRRGLISISHGYGGESSNDEANVRASGSNVNELLRVDEVYDRYSGQPLMSDVAVHVENAISSRPKGTFGQDVIVEGLQCVVESLGGQR
jgi:anaerobic selenocysteine-containing dehydrogenase